MSGYTYGLAVHDGCLRDDISDENGVAFETLWNDIKKYIITIEENDSHHKSRIDVNIVPNDSIVTYKSLVKFWIAKK